MKKYNYIVSVVMLLLSGYIFYESGGYTIGSSAQKNPAVWPCILAGALALLSVALLIMIPAIEYLMGCRSKVMLIALPVGMVAFVYLFFVVAMKLTLPATIWA